MACWPRRGRWKQCRQTKKVRSGPVDVGRYRRISARTAKPQQSSATFMEITEMKHYLYCSSGNTVGLDEYLGFFEIDEDGYCTRYLEIRSDNGRARTGYSEAHLQRAF